MDKVTCRTLWLGLVTLGLVACGGVAGSGTGTGALDGGSTVQPQLSSLYANYLNTCAQCHAPNAPGRTSDIESSLDFSTVQTTYTTLHGQAAGLTGNSMSCNGVPFLGTTAGNSLLYAVLDGPTRQAYMSSSAPQCNGDAISDQTVKVGSAPSPEFMAALKQWIENGAPND